MRAPSKKQSSDLLTLGLIAVLMSGAGWGGVWVKVSWLTLAHICQLFPYVAIVLSTLLGISVGFFQSPAGLKHCSAELFWARSGGSEIEAAEKLQGPVALLTINLFLGSPDTIPSLLDHRRVVLLPNPSAKLTPVHWFFSLVHCSAPKRCPKGHQKKL